MIQHIEMPAISAKWLIGFTALFHLAVAALAIGFATVVTVCQIVGYVQRKHGYDLLAKRLQLIHVCIYNIGTIVAIGLVFALSGLYPQFWSQIFGQFFWTLIVEELLFFLLATTLTFHYFFWEQLWGHKKLHIFLGAMLTPLFLLQFYIINAMGSFMLTPGFREGAADLTAGVLGWSRMGFYNPSFLMLNLHRTFANVAYGGFVAAAICGVGLYFTNRPKVRRYYEDGGRLVFSVGFLCFLCLPIIGFFFALVIKYHAPEAYVNLMWGRGDVVAYGIDWWWLKHIFVAGMLGMGLVYFKRMDTSKGPFSLSGTLVWAIALFYLMFYMAMSPFMTWKFFWVSLGVAVMAAALAHHLIAYHGGSPRALFILVGFFSFMTVMLGGYNREAARPRFQHRIAHYDRIFVKEQRQPLLMIDVPEDQMDSVLKEHERPDVLIPKKGAPLAVDPSSDPILLIRMNCSGCHTLERVKHYAFGRGRWNAIVTQMEGYPYGPNLTHEQHAIIVNHLESAKPY